MSVFHGNIHVRKFVCYVRLVNADKRQCVQSAVTKLLTGTTMSEDKSDKDPGAAADASPRPRTSLPSLPVLLRLSFWIALLTILGFGIYKYESLLNQAKSVRQFVQPDASLRLIADPNFKPNSRLITSVQVSGRIEAFGKPVSDGWVRIFAEDILSQNYLAGGFAIVTNGKFEDVILLQSPGAPLSEAVQINGEFHGWTKDKAGVVQYVKADDSQNIGYPRRINYWAAWGVAFLFVAFGLWLIWLFTGPIDTRKQRFLYIAMYFVVFMSLVVPILISVMLLQSSYLVKVMEKAPIGLVRATSPSSKTELQWFINIGGVVTSHVETTRAPRVKAEDPGKAPDKGGETGRSADKSGAGAGAAESGGIKAAQQKAEGDAESTTGGAGVGQNDVSQVTGSSPSIQGGLAVPFYVVLLAMFGAGINLTRRVPEIQEEYRASVPRARTFFEFLFRSRVAPAIPNLDEERQAYAFRRALIQNYMYVVSAPFLATAVYYLLQVIATEPSRPVLVLVSFATGLISDTLLNRIVRFAEETLKLTPADKADVAREAANSQIDTANALMQKEAAKAHSEVFMAALSRMRGELNEAIRKPSAKLPDVPQFETIPRIADGDATAGELRISVTHNGTPAPQVVVIVKQLPGGKKIADGTTDAQGAVVLKDIPAGKLRIEANDPSAGGQSATSKDIAFAPGPGQKIDLAI